MAWTGNDGPRRSREELFAHVVARGTTLRRRRRAAMATLAGVVAVVLVLSAVTLVGRHGGTTVVSDTAGNTTSTSVASSTVSLPSTTTSVVPVIVLPTTLAAVPSTTVPSTSAPKTTPSTAPRALATTTTVPVDKPACTDSDLVVTITFDQPGSPPAYLPGRTVNATGTLRNVGPETCYTGDGGAFNSQFKNDAGQGVGPSQSSIGDPLEGDPSVPIPVGAFDTESAQWNQECPKAQCAPGTYSVTFYWGLAYPAPYVDTVISATGTASFQLVAAR